MPTCKYLQKDEKAGYYVCNFLCEPKANKNEGNRGCSSCITVPSVMNFLSDSVQSTQTRYKEEVRSELRKGRATFVLGAGVSIPAGMPNWVGLLSQLSGYAIQYREYINYDKADPAKSKKILHLAQELILNRIEILDGVNVLEAGEYVSMLLEPPIEKGYSARIRDDLLKSALSSIVAKSKKPEELLTGWQQKHPGQDPKAAGDAAHKEIAGVNTLLAVAYLLQAKNGFHRAITYNYDTLVQECLISVFGVDESRILTHSEGWIYSDKTSDGVIDLFHVHGCLPRPGRGHPTAAFPKESRRVILSEESYYEMERYGAYDWANSIQSYYLNRDSCVFVGFSAEDYNFRRILRQLGNEKEKNDGKSPKHYLVLTIDQIVKDTYSSVCHNQIKHGNANPGKVQEETILLLEQELAMKEAYWKKHNFYPIWVTVNDIPTTLLSFL